MFVFHRPQRFRSYPGGNFSDTGGHHVVFAHDEEHPSAGAERVNDFDTYPYGDDHLVRLTLMPDLKGVL